MFHAVQARAHHTITVIRQDPLPNRFIWHKLPGENLVISEIRDMALHSTKPGYVSLNVPRALVVALDAARGVPNGQARRGHAVSSFSSSRQWRMYQEIPLYLFWRDLVPCDKCGVVKTG